MRCWRMSARWRCVRATARATGVWWWVWRIPAARGICTSPWVSLGTAEFPPPVWVWLLWCLGGGYGWATGGTRSGLMPVRCDDAIGRWRLYPQPTRVKKHPILPCFIIFASTFSHPHLRMPHSQTAALPSARLRLFTHPASSTESPVPKTHIIKPYPTCDTRLITRISLSPPHRPHRNQPANSTPVAPNSRQQRTKARPPSRRLHVPPERSALCMATPL